MAVSMNKTRQWCLTVSFFRQIKSTGSHRSSEVGLYDSLIFRYIVSRYDIILILEVVDVSGASVKVVNTEHHYTLKISVRLGRNRYKEQFLFLYRSCTKICPCPTHRDDVNDLDAFAREPYILHFRPHNTGLFFAVLKDIVLIPVHTKPCDSEKELDELYEVFLAVRNKWQTDNIMILGDFNADGAYVSDEQMKKIRIRSDKNFHWLIGDDVDTTANTGNEHTYDRIVVYGQDMLAAIVPNSAKPFNFHEEFGIFLIYCTHSPQALRVSDHYPVEVELCCSSPVWTAHRDHRSAPDDRAVTGKQPTCCTTQSF
uniref:Deoxyribonuclease n=1 Tax=Myripristis murdjan TaxID=586833 RepID=A0A667Y3C5_9TELE